MTTASRPPGPNDFLPEVPSFSLTSTDTTDGGTLTESQLSGAFGVPGGKDISPQLSWSGAPEGTKSYAVTCFDPDAPTGSGFWHWAVYNIPPSATSLASNSGNVSSSVAPAGSIQGYTDFGSKGYGGPCPPAGDAAHHYTFTVYAEKVADLGIPQGPTGPPGALVSFAAKSNSIASASFTATYAIAGSPTSHPAIPAASGFTLSSAEIPNGSTIKNAQVFNNLGCTGGNQAPSLSWSGVPAGTKSLVLQMYDPDAPTDSGFWHWSVFNIPPTQTTIGLGDGNGGGGLPGGGTQAVNDYGNVGYGGPCPPAGAAAHHYQFTLYAVSVPDLTAAGLSGGATGALVGFATRANATAQAQFTATYASPASP
jgi:hypothetical protein